MRGKDLRGGSHVLLSNAEGSDACGVVVRDYEWGCLLAGEYSRVMHASAAVKSGKRLCVTGYCGGPILRRAGVM